MAWCLVSFAQSCKLLKRMTLKKVLSASSTIQVLINDPNLRFSPWEELLIRTIQANTKSMSQENNTSSDSTESSAPIRWQNSTTRTNVTNQRKTFLQFTLSIRANTLFQLHFNCPYCTKLLSPQIGYKLVTIPTHILIQSIIKIVQQKLKILTSTTLALYKNGNYFYLQ